MTLEESQGYWGFGRNPSAFSSHHDEREAWLAVSRAMPGDGLLIFCCYSMLSLHWWTKANGMLDQTLLFPSPRFHREPLTPRLCPSCVSQEGGGAKIMTEVIDS